MGGKKRGKQQAAKEQPAQDRSGQSPQAIPASGNVPLSSSTPHSDDGASGRGNRIQGGYQQPSTSQSQANHPVSRDQKGEGQRVQSSWQRAGGPHSQQGAYRRPHGAQKGDDNASKFGGSEYHQRGNRDQRPSHEGFSQQQRGGSWGSGPKVVQHGQNWSTSHSRPLESPKGEGSTFQQSEGFKPAHGPWRQQGKGNRDFGKFKEAWGKHEIRHEDTSASARQHGLRKAEERGNTAPDKVQSSLSLPSKEMSEIKILKASTSKDDIPALPELQVRSPGKMARKVIQVESNHFALNLGTSELAYRYDVSIEEFKKDDTKTKSPEKGTERDEKASRNRRIKDKVQYSVMKAFLQKYFPDRYPSFDGQKILYAARPLAADLNQVLTDTDIVVIDDLGREKQFKIVVKYVKTVSLLEKQEAPNLHAVLPKDAIQCIDIVLRNAPVYSFTQVGRSFFRQGKTIIHLGGGMEMYYGFYQSVVSGGKPLLNVHLVHKAFPKNMPVLDAFLEIIESNDKNRNKPQYTYEHLCNLQEWQKKLLNSFIKTLKVSYAIPNIQTKVIYGVNELAKPANQEIIPSTGATVEAYFRNDKGYQLKYPNIPLLWVGSKKGNIKIPAELCYIEKDQSVKKKLEDFQVRNMITKSATSTKVHKNRTMEQFNQAGYNNSPYVNEFGIKVNDKFETMPARILPTPQLQYKDGSVSVNKGVWSNKIFYEAKTIKKWAIVSLDNFVKIPDLDALSTAFKKSSTFCGITFTERPEFPSFSSRSRYGPPTTSELGMFFSNLKKNNYDIVIVVLPGRDTEKAYSNVKHAAEITGGVLTQCIQSKTVEKITRRNDRSTVTNILLKVNGKLDGVNHTFATKPMVLRDDEPFMLLGADVTHPGPTAGNIPSIAAIIASHDPTGFQYNLTIRLQPPKEENILDLKNVVKKQLLFFYQKNAQTKPAKIIYFRDGVSEGQFPTVLHNELTAIKNACNELQEDGGYNPKVAFLVVQKRHHTRLFPLKDQDSEDQDFQDRSGNIRPGNYNVPAGTCVDTHIVDPNRPNFYLVSHASIKGVARPTKYVTLYDDIGLSSDDIQQLTYYLCHMFARCNRSVSYPAPTYYAHLGALRGKAYIRPALDNETFNMDKLEMEMARIKTKEEILNNNPMFFI